MKNIWKVLEMIIFIAAGAFLGYNSMSGELFRTTKGCVLFFGFILVLILLVVLDVRSNRKHIRQVKEAGINLQKDMSGVVRTPLQQRLACILSLILAWGFIPVFTFLIIWKIGIFYDPLILISIIFLWGVLIFTTLFIIFFWDVIFKEIHFDFKGVAYWKRFHKVFCSWQEFGKEKETKNSVVFYGRHGEKIFTIRMLDDGAQEFLMFYQAIKEGKV